MSVPRLNPFQSPALGLVLDGAVKAKKGRPKDIAARATKLARVARRAPEVVITVRGGGTKGPGHILAHMTYITRNGKVEAENERGEKVEGLSEVKETFKEWGFDLSRGSTRTRAQTVNFVLSMPAGTDPEVVKAAAGEFVREEFSSNHQCLFALHTETPRPHVHLTVKAQGFDLTWLRRTKEDLQNWRDSFAEKLRDRGVDAEATPRKARGVTTVARTPVMYRLEKEPSRSTVMTAKVDEAINEMNGQVPVPDRPWELAIVEQQRQVRETYVHVVQELRRARDSVSERAADQLTTFLKGRPPMETERRASKRKIAEVAAAGRDPIQELPQHGPTNELPKGGKPPVEPGREK